MKTKNNSSEKWLIIIFIMAACSCDALWVFYVCDARNTVASLANAQLVTIVTCVGILGMPYVYADIE